MPASDSPKKISGDTVRADFNALESVVHYSRAAERLGLWASERKLIEQHFPDLRAPLLEAGCGTGRVTLALAELGYTRITAFDFAEELLAQARHFAREKKVTRRIRFHHADATRLDATGNLLGYQTAGERTGHDERKGSSKGNLIGYKSPDESSTTTATPGFAGVLFLFNGLMQIPGRANRRAALRGLHSLARPGAPLLFTTHDRDDEPAERRHWKRQAELWAQDKQDPALVEFGDRYFVDDDHYRVFMHLPDRTEILEDLAATGWEHEWDEMRRRIAVEPKAVKDFSDECRFWVARR
ncbi:MAG: class I SAM-dependent methyltransferase [Candidatus Didemnitutus sp.]|nr:class I SAM-dependent methyltransferase [Candidatus Didemnitutus sp.]